MQSKAPTRSSGLATLATLLGVLLVAPALGQDPVEAEVTPVEPVAEPTAESAADVASTPAAAKPGAVLDYEPTESISEDLSVSFPVDI